MKGKIVAATVSVALIGGLWLMRGGREPSGGMGSQPPPRADRARAVARKVEQLKGQRSHEGWSTENSGQIQASKAVAPGLPKRQRAREQPQDMTESEEPMTSEDESDNPRVQFESLSYTALHDGDAFERASALSSLSSFDDQPVIPVLVKALSDHDPEVRMTALQELAFVTDEPPLDALEYALSDTDPEVRLEALKMIGESGDERAKVLVEKMTSDPDEDVRDEARDIAGVESDDEDDG